MTNGVNGINGGNGGFGIGGFGIFKREEKAPQKEEQQVPVNNYEDTQVDPNKVMDFLNQYNFFVPEVKTSNINAADKVDAATEERVAGYMEQFEMIYGIVVEEFGEELAPAVMDVAMDKLMAAA